MLEYHTCSGGSNGGVCLQQLRQNVTVKGLNRSPKSSNLKTTGGKLYKNISELEMDFYNTKPYLVSI